MQGTAGARGHGFVRSGYREGGHGYARLPPEERATAGWTRPRLMGCLRLLMRQSPCYRGDDHGTGGGCGVARAVGGDVVDRWCRGSQYLLQRNWPGKGSILCSRIGDDFSRPAAEKSARVVASAACQGRGSVICSHSMTTFTLLKSRQPKPDY